ncbi:MAG: hypothetical protein ACLP0J_04900 [Solirubrobacteraceae bacterium]|jgi:hypothetical protein
MEKLFLIVHFPFRCSSRAGLRPIAAGLSILGMREIEDAAARELLDIPVQQPADRYIGPTDQETLG